MILLDTNVVSEPLRPVPDAAVIAWIDAQLIETFYLSAVSMIGATAAAHGLIVASRDTAPFLSLGLKVINPWQQ